MTTLITTKNLYNDASTTTTSTTYAAPASRSIWRYDSANWDGTVEVYFEAVLSHNSGTAYAALHTNAGTIVTGSEVSTTATGATRVRSGNIFSNIANANDYTVRIKASGATATFYNARIIIKQTGTITKKEYYIPLIAGFASTAVTSFAEQIRSCIVAFDPSQWDGTYSVFLEADGNVSSGDTGFVTLRDTTASTNIGSVSWTTVSPAVGRVRTTALTMNSGAALYRCHYRSNIGLSVTLVDACLIVVQSGTPTKGVFHSALKNMVVTTTSTTSVLQPGSQFYWDDDEWDVASQSIEYEATILISNGASTATSEVFGGTLADIATSATAKTRVADTINPDDNTEYGAYLKTSNASHTATMYGPRFVSYVDFSIPPAFKPKVIII